MIDVQNSKMVIMLRPQLKNNGAFANNIYVDTLNFRHLRVLFLVGDTDTTIGSTGATSAVKLEECDTSGGSYSDISGGALADAIADDEDNSLFAIDVELTDKKRFVRVNAPTAGNGATGANLAVLGILSNPDISPSDATGQGLTEWIKV